MKKLEIALVEWARGVENGAPRVLGRLADTDLVDEVRSRLADEARSQLSSLESSSAPQPPLRVIRAPEGSGEPDAG